MRTTFYRAVSALLLMAAISSVNAAGLMVSDPWVRAAPPNAPALAAFMTPENHSGSDLSVVAVRTALPVTRTEMHRTMMADGMMKMMQQKEMPVAAHNSLMLKPGSWHIMMIGPDKVPTEGELVALTLVLSDGSEQQVMAKVRKGQAMMKGGHHSHMMQH